MKKIIIKRIIILIIIGLFIGALFLLHNLILRGCHNYSGWYKAEIPTEPEYRGKIKIPNEWEFTEEEGIVYLKNKTNNEIIAEQIFQGKKIHKQDDNEKFTYPWEELKFNPRLNDNFKNEDNYKLDRGPAVEASIYQYNDGEIEQYCLRLEIYMTTIKRALQEEYFLMMIFREDIDRETLIKMADAFYCYGCIKLKK